MTDSATLVDYFRETLPWSLQRPIVTSEIPPNTLEDWYTKATNFYVGYKRAQRLFKKKEEKPTTNNAGGSTNPPRRFAFPQKRDPNAMDVDQMSTEERTKLMKEGKCFRCKNFGHLSRDCPNKNGNNAPKKWDGKSAAAHIRAIISSMSEEEKKALEEEGNKSGLGF